VNDNRQHGRLVQRSRFGPWRLLKCDHALQSVPSWFTAPPRQRNSCAPRRGRRTRRSSSKEGPCARGRRSTKTSSPPDWRARAHRIQPNRSVHERGATRRELPGRSGLVLLHWARPRSKSREASCLLYLSEQVRPSIILSFRPVTVSEPSSCLRCS